MKNKKEISKPKKAECESPENRNKTAEDIINEYGTYEIQKTSDTDNRYPFIAQGYNKKLTK